MTDAPLEPWEISPQDVSAMLKAGDDFLFIDCRKPEEHQAAHIAGTTLIPLHDLNDHLPALRGHEDRLVVVHCKSGQRSMIMTQVLHTHGFTNVKSMAGGIQRWSQEIDPSLVVA